MYNLSNGRKILGVSTKAFKRDGAFANYISIPQHILHKIPDNVSFIHAAMVEPAAVAMHAVNLTPVCNDDNAVVVGSGMIGSFVIQLLKIKGCGKIFAIDIDQDRIEFAKKLGATHGIDAHRDHIRDVIYEATGDRGADVAFEVVGISECVNSAIESLRKGGTLTLIGNLTSIIEVPLQSIVTNQIRLQGAYAIAGEYPAVLDMIATGLIDTESVLSAVAPLSEGAIWFERLYRKEKGLMKVVLVP
jgi:L-iditol 2-dehydrogenase